MNLRTDFYLDGINYTNFVNLSSLDIEKVRSWRNNDRIRNCMYFDHLISIEEHLTFIHKLRNDDKNFYWLGKDSNKTYLGVVYLNRVDMINRSAYLGIYTNPDKQLKSGNKLIGFLKWLAFNMMDLHTLKLEVMENNKNAINFYKNGGFLVEGVISEVVYRNSEWRNIIIMGTKNNKH